MAEGCALVTGAARGIGAAVALRLAAADRPVAVNYRADEEGAKAVVAQIEEAGGSAYACQADVADAGQVEALFEDLQERFGTVSVLVNNAGVRADALTPQISEDEWSLVIQTNLSAAYRTTRRALGPMLRARYGRIVNIASIVGPRANAGQSNYAASKAGLIGFTKTVAVEVARRGITVNAVAPGLVETKLTEDLDDRLLKAVPAGRAGTPDDVAACVEFLVSDAAAYVTGATLTVDGGLSA